MKQENKFRDDVRGIVLELANGGLFTRRVIVDTPTDAFSVTNRKYVTLNGPSSGRPRSSVVGQFYFDTSLNKPLWWNGTGFVDATGNFH